MLCHDVSHTSKQCAASDKQLVQIENKCGWMEGAKSRIPLKHVCCHFTVIHLDLLPPSSRTQSLRSVDNYEQRSPGKDGGGRQTDGQDWKGNSSGPGIAPIQIYCLYSCSGHFTAVFTLDPAVSIRWQSPGLQIWLPIHRSTSSQSILSSSFFFFRPPTLLIKKENPKWCFPLDHYS